jgi:diaminobutyrate-2-oxoglutarate transaminase
VDQPIARESNVRFYSRRWPTVFARATGSRIVDEHGTEYLDFFVAAGSLNYGHNPPVLIDGAVDYLRSGGPLNGLDTATVARRDFLAAFAECILRPRGLPHRVQFTGPTGASAVEAALRLARKTTGRRRVVCLTGGYHGMTVDAAAVSDLNEPAGLPTLDDAEVTRIPHELDTPSTVDALRWLHDALDETRVPPAALLLETVQGEGGARPLSHRYLRAAEDACTRTGAVMIVDDVQAGCGRTGTFFSFEPAGVTPGIVCLSKSISGLGLPLSLNLIHPSLDLWAPGEHSGTFRGNQLAFVTARLAIEHWWHDDRFARAIAARSQALAEALTAVATHEAVTGPVHGRGMLRGLPVVDRAFADVVADRAFDNGLLVETCGVDGSVVKVMPPLTVTGSDITQGARILRNALDLAAAGRRNGTADQPVTVPR